MKQNIYITPEGVINFCTVPVPEYTDMAPRRQDYDAAIKHCKESSIPFEDQGFVRSFMSNTTGKIFTKRDTFYPIDCEVEIVEQWKYKRVHGTNHYWSGWLITPPNDNEKGFQHRKVARLKVDTVMNSDINDRSFHNLPVSDSKEEHKPVTSRIVCYNPDVLPKRSEDAPEFSVIVGIIDEHGLDGLGYYCFDDKEWAFHTDTLVDYNEPENETKWKWYYIPVTWEQASEQGIKEESHEAKTITELKYVLSIFVERYGHLGASKELLEKE